MGDGLRADSWTKAAAYKDSTESCSSLDSVRYSGCLATAWWAAMAESAERQWPVPASPDICEITQFNINNFADQI